MISRLKEEDMTQNLNLHRKDFVLTVEHLIFHCQRMKFTFSLSARCATKIEIDYSASW